MNASGFARDLLFEAGVYLGSEADRHFLQRWADEAAHRRATTSFADDEYAEGSASDYARLGSHALRHQTRSARISAKAWYDERRCGVRMPLVLGDLWDLTFGRRHIDADELATAIERAVVHESLDDRTRLLIRDSLEALFAYWGEQRFRSWLAHSARKDALEEILRLRFDEPGFPSIRQRLMEAIRPEIVLQFLRDLGERLTHGARIEVGGAIALILAGRLSRSTEDIDVVDEIPQSIRDEHELLDELAREYGLRLTHFQSHYLPSGWADRIQSVGRFGRLDVFRVDLLDIFVGKLFSARRKDLGDLRVIAPALEKAQITDRVRSSATGLFRQPDLAENATRNWYILYGEPFLPWVT